ncbi:MAG: MarR family transcriptional regulator, partial [Clostridiales bacterium]|nr:MarR family transcriptional regulator [Clostridiales bacterium]
MQAANEVLHAYLQVNRRISEELRGHFGKQNLTFPQTLVLTLLDSDGPMPISTLAKATGSANSTISGVVDRLENAGRLRRVRAEQDRRGSFVEGSDKYRELQEE